jgi:restriction system protein
MTTIIYFLLLTTLSYLVLKLIESNKRRKGHIKSIEKVTKPELKHIQIEAEEAIIISEEKQQAEPNEKSSINLKSIREKKQEIEDAVILNEIKADRKPPPQQNSRETVREDIENAKPKKTEQIKEWSLELLLSLEWKRFEEVCRDYFIATGLDARLTRSGADGGVDIQIYENNQIVCLIQCKAWTWKIGVKEIRELYGIMASEKVNNGIFITTSSYTQDAIIFSKEKNVRLFDGKDLIKRIKMLPPDQQKKLLAFATAGDYTTPTCPNCGTKLIRRSGKKKDFWGCMFYPRCRSTIQMRKAY